MRRCPQCSVLTRHKPPATAAGLHDMRRYLEGEGDAESSQFLAVLEVHSKKKQVACFSCT